MIKYFIFMLLSFQPFAILFANAQSTFEIRSTQSRILNLSSFDKLNTSINQALQSLSYRGSCNAFGEFKDYYCPNLVRSNKEYNSNDVASVIAKKIDNGTKILVRTSIIQYCQNSTKCKVGEVLPFNKDVHDEFFKALSQELFIDSIEITPLTIN
jgi:hypothetical protein